MVWVPIWREALSGMTQAAPQPCPPWGTLTTRQDENTITYSGSQVRAREAGKRIERAESYLGMCAVLVLEPSVALVLWWRHATGLGAGYSPEKRECVCDYIST